MKNSPLDFIAAKTNAANSNTKQGKKFPSPLLRKISLTGI